MKSTRKLTLLNKKNKTKKRYKLDLIVYCFWTGTNKMSTDRKACLDSMEPKIGCKVVCIYAKDVNKYILPKHPLHEAYEYLSETHKADYLRTYFMNFYGGGYSDIKKSSGSWINSFKKLQNSDAWVIGYKEKGAKGVAGPPSLKAKWQDLIGNCAYICKPNTAFTNEWYDEMMSLLDKKLDKLKQFPSTFPQDCAEKSPGKYPIEWNEMLGRIFHRLNYKYKDHFMNTLPPTISKNYR